jgi:hypothetical protein
MKYWCLLIALLATAPSVYADSVLTPRPLDPWAGESLNRGLTHSALVRELVATLEASNVVVHIETSTLMPFGLGGLTKFVTSQHGYRYVRIMLARDLSPYYRAAVLGHELQHACEIARSTADTHEAVRALFERLGHADSKQPTYFETPAALLAGRQVAGELRRNTTSRLAVEGFK